MKKRRVTLADIAKRAGTHVTTVSLAMRNSHRLSTKTRERIKKLAKEMGYVPDPWLRALVSYRDTNREHRNPPVLAYVTNWNTKWGWKDVHAHPDFYLGAEKKAEELGFTLEHFWMREPGMTHKRLNRIFKARGINGLIIASHVHEIDDYLEFDWDNFSAVKIDYFPHKPELAMVTNNQFHITRLAMQKVIDAGYKRIGFVMDQGWDITVDNLWCAGFLWEQQKIDPADRIDPYLFPAEEKIEDWLVRNQPEVIVGKDEFVVDAFRNLNWKVPDDIAFVDLFLENKDEKIAGVFQNHETVGALAIEMLSSQIQLNQRGIPEIPITTYVEGTWVDGKTLPIPAQFKEE